VSGTWAGRRQGFAKARPHPLADFKGNTLLTAPAKTNLGPRVDRFTEIFSRLGTIMIPAAGEQAA
jgi:hypothetical protein